MAQTKAMSAPTARRERRVGSRPGCGARRPRTTPPRCEQIPRERRADNSTSERGQCGHPEANTDHEEQKAKHAVAGNGHRTPLP